MARDFDRDARKAELAEAVWRIIVERGIGAVSVRSVAQEAGVVVGSLRYVFPTRAELLVFSAELMLQRATERVLATPRDPDPVAYTLAVASHLLPLEPDSRAEFDVNVALIAEAPAVPMLRAVRDEAYGALDRACARLVAILRGQQASDDLPVDLPARRLHAVIDGLALHLMMQDPKSDTTWALNILREELVSIQANNQGDGAPSTIESYLVV